MTNKKITTIMVYVEDKELLDKLAEFRKESYREIFHRLIKKAFKKEK